MPKLMLPLLTAFLLAMNAFAAPQNCDQTAAQAMTNALTSNNWYYRMDDTATNVKNHGIGYYPIPAAGSSDGKALGILDRATWLKENKAQAPIYLPHLVKNMKLATGWMYAADRGHNALDYSLSGDTFEVRAVADGEVVHVGYMPSPGNVVIIEHTQPNGFKFRTISHHLRNGRDSDVKLAKLTMTHSAKYSLGWETDDYAKTYQAMADEADQILKKANPTAAELEKVKKNFGTNAQTLFVKEGDKVKAGQVIGWAGRTGMHQTGVHLHIMFAREATHQISATKTEKRWTFFDPYGLYALDTECYNVEKPTGTGTNQHPTVYAPYFREFTNLGVEAFQAGFNYFASMGWAPRLLSYSDEGFSQLSGSFAPTATGAIPFVRVNNTFAQFQKEVDTIAKKNFIPDLVSASSGNEPLFAAIFAPVTGAAFVSHAMTEDAFGKKIGELGKDYVLRDFSVYVKGGKQVLYFGVWLKKPNGGYYVYGRMTEADLKKKDTELRAKGFGISKLEMYREPGTNAELYSALWHPAPGALAPLLNATLPQFESNRTLHEALGHHVKSVHQFGGKWSAVFGK